MIKIYIIFVVAFVLGLIAKELGLTGKSSKSRGKRSRKQYQRQSYRRGEPGGDDEELDVDVDEDLVNEGAAIPMQSLHFTRAAIFTASERTFFLTLQNAVGRQFYIFPKVRLIDVARNVEYAGKFRVIAKHVDFLLCSPSSFQPVLVIELDDYTHARKSAQKRDAVKDMALASAGVPILRVTDANVDAAWVQKTVAACALRDA